MVKDYVVDKLAEHDGSDLMPVGYLESQVGCTHCDDLLGVGIGVDEDIVVKECQDHLSHDGNHGGSSN